MTAEQHFELNIKHTDNAKAALHRFIESGEHGNCDYSHWEEFKREYKLANRHYGVYKAMKTKEAKKLAGG